MDKILNAVKCANCRNMLDSPVILPCGCSICHKHTHDQTSGSIICCLCGMEHQLVPNRASFPANTALARIIKSQINALEFGEEHKTTKKSCTRLNDLITDFDCLLKDPFNFTYEAIEYLKNVAQLKVEQMKLKLDEELVIVIGKLDEFKSDCKTNLKSNEYLSKMGKFEERKETAREELKKWEATLNELKLNEPEWGRIKSECEKVIERVENELIKFKMVSLNSRRFKEHCGEVEKYFGKFEIDSRFKFSYKPISLNSKILVNMEKELLNLCEFEWDQELVLLYRGSLHGFGAENFHSKCDNIPRTLTVIKASKSGNIFGGYTEAMWDKIGWQFDEKAFIFSLVNNEKKPVKVNVAKGSEKFAIYSSKALGYGPCFGEDIVIRDNNNNRCSYFGTCYVLSGYLEGTEHARRFLAGSNRLLVEEIEVFQLVDLF